MNMENIIACVRIKPVQGDTKNEDEICCGKFEDNSVLNFKTNEKFDFEYVFDENNSTNQIFDQIGIPLIDACFQGINVCIFAYGQTSSGKTFTMKGSKDQPGFIPQSLAYIFKELNEHKIYDVEIKSSYIEIYNENVNDLLNPTNINLEIRENLTKGVHIPTLTETIVRSHNEAMDLFNLGESTRKFGETCLNEQSSRSHTIFRIALEMRTKMRPDKVVYSTLSLIDLAGSEGVSRAKTEGLRKREGANINKSLLALSTVISKLAAKDINFINYRDSKLTRLLQPSLGGNSRTVVICTINPLFSNYQETINTLKFGISAGAIKNQVRINEKVNEKTSLKKEQLKELNDYKAEWHKNKEMFENKMLLYTNKINDLEKQIGDLLDDNAGYMQELDCLKEERNKLLDKVKKNDDELIKLKRDNEQLIGILNEIEESTKKDFEKKTNEFQNAYSLLEKKLKAIDSENMFLKQENCNLRSDMDKIHQMNQIIINEKNDLINEYKIHIENLKKTIDTINHKKLSNEKENIQFNNYNAKNIINISKISQSISSTHHSQQQQQQHHYASSCMMNPNNNNTGNVNGNVNGNANGNTSNTNSNTVTNNSNCNGLNNIHYAFNSVLNPNCLNKFDQANSHTTMSNNNSNGCYHQQQQQQQEQQQQQQQQYYGQNNLPTSRPYPNQYHYRKNEDDDLRLLEIETNFKSQLIQKNKALAELNTKLVEITREYKRKDDRIFELENELLYYKTMNDKQDVIINGTPKSFNCIRCSKDNNNDQNHSNSCGDVVMKKRKLDEYSYVTKKVKTSPDKEELKKEIKYLENKNKNFEKQLQKRRFIEEEYSNKIQDLLKQNLALENKINSEMLMMESFM